MSVSGLRVTFLGTGTSVGIPVITCGCRVCTSEDPRNARLRAGLLLEWPHEHEAGSTAIVLVDTPTDLRQQALTARIPRVDAVLYTHGHADHLLGLDELRIYNFVHKRPIPLYGSAETLAVIERMFRYAFDGSSVGVPRLELHEIEQRLDQRLDLFGQRIEVIPVQHGYATTLAFRIGDFAYVTDCNAIPEGSASRLTDLDVLVIDALRRKPHRSHFSLDEALSEIERLQPRRALLTHLGHDLEHAELSAELPDRIGIAHDGLVLELPCPDAA